MDFFGFFAKPDFFYIGAELVEEMGIDFNSLVYWQSPSSVWVIVINSVFKDFFIAGCAMLESGKKSEGAEGDGFWVDFIYLFNQFCITFFPIGNGDDGVNSESDSEAQLFEGFCGIEPGGGRGRFFFVFIAEFLGIDRKAGNDRVRGREFSELRDVGGFCQEEQFMFMLIGKNREQALGELNLFIPDQAIRELSCVKHAGFFSGINPVSDFLEHSGGIGKDGWLGPVSQGKVEITVVAFIGTAIGKSQDIKMWADDSGWSFIKVMDKAGMPFSEDKPEFFLFFLVQAEKFFLRWLRVADIIVCASALIFLFVGSHCAMGFPGSNSMFADSELVRYFHQGHFWVLADKIQHLVSEFSHFLFILLLGKDSQGFFQFFPGALLFQLQLGSYKFFFFRFLLETSFNRFSFVLHSWLINSLRLNFKEVK